MKGMIIIILMVLALVYSAFTFIPQGEERSNTRVSSQSTTTTVLHIDTRIARNLE